MRTGGPRTTSRSARSTCSTTRCCGSRCARAHQAAPARPLGHDARAELHLCPPEPRHPAARPRTRSTSSGPGTAGPAIVANAYLEGTYTEVYPTIARDADGDAQPVPAVLVPRRHPQPRGARDARLDPRGRRARLRARPRYGAAFDNPDLLVVLRHRRRRGRDRPAGGELALEQVPQPGARRAVLPILHLNGYKIANPTVLARIPDDELRRLLEGYGYEPCFVDGDDPASVHQQMAAALDAVIGRHRDDPARRARTVARPAPALADDRAADAEGLDRTEGGRRPAGRGHVARRTRSRSADARRTPSTSRSSRLDAQLPAEELFDDDGAIAPSCGVAPKAKRRMSANPHANGGAAAARTVGCPTSATTPSRSRDRARRSSERPRACSARSCATSSATTRTNFRLVRARRAASNRLDAVFEATDRAWMAETRADDDHLAREVG